MQPAPQWSDKDIRRRRDLQIATDVMRTASRAIDQMAERLDEAFIDAVARIVACRGSVIVCGMGKAGLIGQKIAATFASTGTRSHFLHPSEALHGDLGRIGSDDLLLLLSHSGETDEVIRVMQAVERLQVDVIGVTGRLSSRLARGSRVVLWIGDVREAGPLSLAPSTSTSAMLALGDALALVSCDRRGFESSDFAQLHPSGSLGKRLGKVEDVMRSQAECRIAHREKSVRQVFVTLTRPGRRSGAVLLVDEDQRLVGIFTDSDLARLLEADDDQLLDRPIAEFMTHSPLCVRRGTLVQEAVGLMAERKISELPVLDRMDRIEGLIDVTDVLEFLPAVDDLDATRSDQTAEGTEDDGTALRICRYDE